MRSSFLTTALAAAALSVAACGSGYSSPASPSVSTASSPSPAPSPAPVPGTPAAATSSSVTVNIVGEVGSQAFNPNPVAAAAGDSVVFRNNDVTIHHIVLDNGSADLGNVSPGQSTRAFTVSTSGAMGFHCTIHPSMVGTINGSVASSAPAPDPGQSY